MCSTHYPSGNVGIGRHRDREMGGRTIACLSFGADRTLTLTPFKYLHEKERRYALPSGSLYVLLPPTNVHWMHSIEKDNTTIARISLTFRYVNV